MDTPVFTKDKVAQTKTFLPIKGHHSENLYPVTLQVSGDLGTDVITVTLFDNSDASETDDYNADLTVNTLTKTNPKMTFYGPVNIKVSKDADTTNNIGLNLVSV